MLPRPRPAAGSVGRPDAGEGRRASRPGAPARRSTRRGRGRRRAASTAGPAPPAAGQRPAEQRRFGAFEQRIALPRQAARRSPPAERAPARARLRRRAPASPPGSTAAPVRCGVCSAAASSRCSTACSLPRRPLSAASTVIGSSPCRSSRVVSAGIFARASGSAPRRCRELPADRPVRVVDLLQHRRLDRVLRVAQPALGKPNRRHPHVARLSRRAPS